MGTLILVKPGDRVPMDGEVTRGTSTVDESMLTGEAKPVEKAPGAAVFGGTLNCGSSPLEVGTDSCTEWITTAGPKPAVSSRSHIHEPCLHINSQCGQSMEEGGAGGVEISYGIN